EPILKRKFATRRWRTPSEERDCSISVISTCQQSSVARMSVRRNPASRHERPSRERIVPDDPLGPSRFLPLAHAAPSHSGGDGTARPNAESGVGVSRLGVPENYGRVAEAL